MFRFFRRHQKIFIVVGGVILMLVFTVGDALNGWVRSQDDSGDRRNPNATAVTWDGGKLSEGELSSLLYKRQIVAGFVQTAAQVGYQRSIEAELTPVPRVVPVALIGQEWTRDVLEEDVVRRHILAQRAEDMGIYISDDVIRRYIDELGLGQLDPNDVLAILSAMNPAGRSPSTSDLFDSLRSELMTEAALRAYGASGTYSGLDLGATELPVDRWEEWKRINDYIIVEAAAIDPSSSMVDVPEPTADELQAYYVKYKDNPAFPIPLRDGTMLPAPTPGFMIPRKVKLAYLRADYEEIVAKFESEVTDEQIAQYYEDYKFQFTINDDLSIFDDPAPEEETPAEEPAAEESTDTDAPATEESAPEEPADEAEAAEEPMTEEQPASEEPATEEPAAEEPAAEGETAEEPMTEEQPEPEAPAEEEPAAEEPATEEPAPEAEPAEEPATEGESPATEEPATGEAEGENTESGEATESRPSPFRLVSLQEETPAEEPATEEATETETPAEPAVTEEAPAEEAAADTDSEAVMAEETAEPEVTEEVQYEPLEKVKDKIRRLLAENRYTTEIDEVMQSAARDLQPAYRKYVSDSLSMDEGTPEPAIKLSDLTTLGEKYGLQVEDTGELSFYELFETEAGKSFCDSKYMGDMPAQVYAAAFRNIIDLFEPTISSDIAGYGDRYVVIKLSDSPSRVPTFDEVKDDVIAAWKREQAADKALEKAKALAIKVQDSGLTLESYFVGDDKVVEVTKTPSFTLYTAGDFAPTGQATYRPSQPQGLKDVGPDFLAELFKLSEGEVTALQNFDKSLIYIVRNADDVESPEMLRSNFLEVANYWDGRGQFRNAKAGQFRSSVIEALLNDLNLTWKREDAADSDSEETADEAEAESEADTEAETK
ncbi:hypothetical protein [Aeoliella mucimassa]|uniref:Periplasmic folding chaperone n=1 Tax=Aeoliella mucimassa TaxID=2527972 RepID=A0A518AT93_9BACT|nr:hypothetical protein [Aeoliella mucimassa]QDU57959.1 periplasmic folding chaperone [Aeoliella mucimassa]